jgi:serine O-acetyltransferase
VSNLVERLIRAQKLPLVGRIAKEFLAILGVEFPASVKYGTGLNIVHRGVGVVITPFATIGNHVTIYHQVTLGRADSWVPIGSREFPGIAVGDHAVLCPGAKLLGSFDAPLKVGEGTVIGANAVLTQSTGPWEIWAGAPARKVGQRSDRGGAE